VASGVAFTIADVAAAAGGLVLVPAAAALVAWLRRGRLGEPVALELR
jgi:hypothetical protein